VYNCAKLLSFSDSVLSGYILDGYKSANIDCGLGDFSGCTFAYYLIHLQGIELDKNRPMGLPEHYENYLSNLGKHCLYAVVLNKENFAELLRNENIIIPNSIPNVFESNQACFQSGEDFHPRLKLTSSLKNNILPIYINNEIL